MTTLLRLIAALLLCACGLAHAQAVPVPIQLSWTNPTTSVDGVPLTGPYALTGIEIHWSTSPIADSDTNRSPQVTLGVVATTTQTINATNGSTLYFRARAVRGAEKSAYSNQASKQIALSTVPLPPTNLNIVIMVSRAEDGSFQMAMMVDEDRSQSIYVGG